MKYLTKCAYTSWNVINNIQPPQTTSQITIAITYKLFKGGSVLQEPCIGQQFTVHDGREVHVIQRTVNTHYYYRGHAVAVESCWRNSHYNTLTFQNRSRPTHEHSPVQIRVKDAMFMFPTHHTSCMIDCIIMGIPVLYTMSRTLVFPALPFSPTETTTITIIIVAVLCWVPVSIVISFISSLLPFNTLA